nr:uncharacterized protein LOC108389706 isoform X8 [Manis javanica]
MLGPRRLSGLMRRFCIGQQDVGEDHWSVRGVSPRASLTVTVCGLGSPSISTPLVACGEGAELLRKVPLAALGSSSSVNGEAPYRSLNISSQCGHWPEEPSQSRPSRRADTARASVGRRPGTKLGRAHRVTEPSKGGNPDVHRSTQGPGDTALRETSPTRKDRPCGTPLPGDPWRGRSTETDRG